MPRKERGKKDEAPKNNKINAYIAGSGIVAEQRITETLEKNYMPYAMSVIVSRALPEIDGFKPSHRKLLYTMYTMGLLNGGRTKSANIVGQTMKLNPHGDGAIYETMVRLARGNEALLHPYVDSKGNFGKAWSRDMAYAASRYTEAKLDPICAELFRDIDKDTVDFQPNYDNTTTEPTLFPTTFPSVLVNSNVGIAVSMASAVCPFNLAEVCETTIALMKDPDHDALTTLKGPDFPGGGLLVYDEEELKKIYSTGRGSVKIRSKYEYDSSDRCIDVKEIPPTTTIEAIRERIIELIKNGKIRDISDVRDESDLDGMKLTIDIKKGVDPDKLMQKLFKLTPLQDSYSCNFNILIDGSPKVMGVYEILGEWIKFRKKCISRRVSFDLKKKKEKLHLLKGLEKIILDIDKAIRIVRETEEDSEVVPNLMIGFGIDEVQAEYVAEIKLRQLNKEYILNRIADIEQLEKDIAEMEAILGDEKKIENIITGELKDVMKKYRQPRKTLLYFAADTEEDEPEEDSPDYPVTVFLSKSGYFKCITPQSLRMASEQKFKDGDSLDVSVETTKNADLLFFTDQCRVYKSKASDFADTKASVLGDYIPAKLSFDEGENVVAMVVTADYSGYVLMMFENGKAARVPINSYETKTNRKRLTNAYSDKSPLVKLIPESDTTDILVKTDNGRALLFNTGMILPKTTRDTIGVQVVNLKPKAKVENCYKVSPEKLEEYSKFAVKSVPAVGMLFKDMADPDQLTL
ncbi:MAG: DNA topoisomerase (ATP-hydrolyzing) subunit A [Oscillospiraceae bacterium]|nr:DNA topoisomerase (ATP-hydrolyzing) subunit A [Oscillospiraceae bacterium]